MDTVFLKIKFLVLQQRMMVILFFVFNLICSYLYLSSTGKFQLQIPHYLGAAGMVLYVYATSSKVVTSYLKYLGNSNLSINECKWRTAFLAGFLFYTVTSYGISKETLGEQFYVSFAFAGILLAVGSSITFLMSAKFKDIVHHYKENKETEA